MFFDSTGLILCETSTRLHVEFNFFHNAPENVFNYVFVYNTECI